MAGRHAIEELGTAQRSVTNGTGACRVQSECHVIEPNPGSTVDAREMTLTVCCQRGFAMNALPLYLAILSLSGFVTSFGAHIVATNLPTYADTVGAGAL